MTIDWASAREKVFAFKVELSIGGACLAAGLISGLWFGWKFWRPKPRPVETYAAASTQKDGSTILERKPDAKAHAVQHLPKDAVLERVVQVQVIPVPGERAIVDAPVTVDLSLIRLPDQSRRVVVSSPDGRVTGGVDIPVEAAKPVRDLKWAAGVTYNPADKAYGAFVDRDVAFLRMGAELVQVRVPDGRTTWAAHLKVGIRF